MPDLIARKIVAGARRCLGDRYDPAYVSLRYPGGDVARGRGVCTDVVIRALRAAGYDLQHLVHEDMAAHFALYPKKWGLRRPDPNIDHRRVPNLQVFFRRHGRTLPHDRDFQPGDIVTWVLPGGRPHTGVVSDSGRVKIIHNIGPVAAEEDALFAWPIDGHFRYPRR